MYAYFAVFWEWEFVGIRMEDSAVKVPYSLANVGGL